MEKNNFNFNFNKEANDDNLAVQSENMKEELTKEEMKLVEEFAKKIDIRDQSVIVNYGSEIQGRLNTFTEKVLAEAKTSDLGEIGSLITTVVNDLSSCQTGEVKGIRVLFKKGMNSIKTLQTRYNSVEKNVDNIAKKLQEHQKVLWRDYTILEEMYNQNITYYKQLTLYIEAGKLALREAQEEMKMLLIKAEESKKSEDIQLYNDYAEQYNRFERKLFDLETTRVISIQMAPQVRLLQNNTNSLTEKIQSLIINSIPLWKSQLVLALGTENSRKAAEVSKQVSDITNELLRRNAEQLKLNTISVATELERGIVDTDTLQYVNDALIETLNSLIKVQDEGRERRMSAEIELQGLEEELKNVILSAGNGYEVKEETAKTLKLTNSTVK